MIRKRLIGLVCTVCLLSICLSTLTGKAAASLTVYPGPGEDIRSPRYQVELSTDGETFVDSFVYLMVNHLKEDFGIMEELGDANHFTIFDISGPVTARVTDLEQDIETVELLPERDGGAATITGARQVTVQLGGPGYYYVEIDGEEGEQNPLFLFADPPQTDIPDSDDPTVHYFAAGYHTVGLDYEIAEGETLYLEGGAFVHGTILVTEPLNTRIAGRGIISGKNYQIYEPEPLYQQLELNHHAFDYVWFMDPGNNLLEGLTSIYPAGYHTDILGTYNTSIRNLKCLSWRAGTDAVETSFGGQSTVRDVFMKVSDDNVKFNTSDGLTEDLIVWQQHTSGIFNFGYNAADWSVVENRVVRNVDILRCTGTTNIRNSAIFTLPSLNGGQRRNLVFENVTIYDDVLSLFGFYADYLPWFWEEPQEAVPGQIEDFTFRNIDLRGTETGTWAQDSTDPNWGSPLLSYSYMDPAFSYFAAGEGSFIRNFTFENVRINGKWIQSFADFPNGGARVIGDVTGFRFICTADTDGDGLRDVWETRDLDLETPEVENPFDPDEADSTGDDGPDKDTPDGVPDGYNDYDGDGMSNRHEFMGDYDPLDDTSFGEVPVAWWPVALVLLAVGFVLLGIRRRKPAR